MKLKSKKEKNKLSLKCWAHHNKKHPGKIFCKNNIECDWDQGYFCRNKYQNKVSIKCWRGFDNKFPRKEYCESIDCDSMQLLFCEGKYEDQLEKSRIRQAKKRQKQKSKELKEPKIEYIIDSTGNRRPINNLDILWRETFEIVQNKNHIEIYKLKKAFHNWKKIIPTHEELKESFSYKYWNPDPDDHFYELFEKDELFEQEMWIEAAGDIMGYLSDCMNCEYIKDKPKTLEDDNLPDYVKYYLEGNIINIPMIEMSITDRENELELFW